MTTKPLGFRIPQSLAEQVDQRAERLGRSPAWIVEQALIAWLDDDRVRRRFTLDALADVDAGRVVDHRTIQGLAAHEAAQRLAQLGGSQPDLSVSPRRRPI